MNLKEIKHTETEKLLRRHFTRTVGIAASSVVQFNVGIHCGWFLIQCSEETITTSWQLCQITQSTKHISVHVSFSQFHLYNTPLRWDSSVQFNIIIHWGWFNTTTLQYKMKTVRFTLHSIAQKKPLEPDYNHVNFTNDCPSSMPLFSISFSKTTLFMKASNLNILQIIQIEERTLPNKKGSV